VKPVLQQTVRIGIYQATRVIASKWAQDQYQGSNRVISILSDSKWALQALARPRHRSEQQIVHTILKAAQELKTIGIRIRLQWISGHCDDPGNNAADRLTKGAVGLHPSHQFRNLLWRERGTIRDKIITEWETEWKGSSKGGHLRRIDSGLPSIHTRHLYGSLPRNRAYLLTQLRTGHSWLASHAKLHRFREDDKCECDARETVVHVLIDCPRLSTLRQKLREEVGEAFNNITLMLGGRDKQGPKKSNGSVQRKAVNAVLDFAEASLRFQSRVARGP
jgi:hypothetical protein